MPRLSWTPSSRADLRSIDDWLTKEASSDLAIRIVSAIRARAQMLQDFPHIGRPHRGDTRILRVLQTPYLIRYRVRRGAVEILRLYHERENWHVEP